MSQTPLTVAQRCLPPILLALSALGAIISAPSTADIWGYVDDQGVAHLSDHQVNERYFLFKKEAPRPKAEAFDYSAFENGAAAGSLRAANPALRAQFAPLIAQVAQEYSLDVSLLHAIITVESGYNPQAKSPAGAIGLMQLMPGTAQKYGVRNIWDPLENLQGGARYLRFLQAMFPDKLDLVLAAYNAGEGAVQQAGMKIPPYAETKAYVPSVINHYQRYRAAVTPAGTVPAPVREQPLLIR
ncbi:MAG: lytic transglycosylase domain-containing protein [Burkholderiales bacterium]